jgi:hypothetical protein
VVKLEVVEKAAHDQGDESDTQIDEPGFFLRSSGFSLSDVFVYRDRKPDAGEDGNNQNDGSKLKHDFLL